MLSEKGTIMMLIFFFVAFLISITFFTSFILVTYLLFRNRGDNIKLSTKEKDLPKEGLK